MTRILVWSIAAVGTLVCAVECMRGQSCARTPELAAAGVATASSDGYRLVAVHDDLLHNARWAMVTRCERPFAPWIAVRVPAGITVAETTRLEVGSVVRVRMHGGASWLEVEGTVQGSARLGERVRVQVKGNLFGEQAAQRTLWARVTDATTVEVE